MKRIGYKLDGHAFEEEALFKKDSTMKGRKARKNCKIIARAEKRSENYRMVKEGTYD